MASVQTRLPRAVGHAWALAKHNMSPNFSAMRVTPPSPDIAISPLLNVDWFDMREPFFRPHPHAGFSAVTYVFPDSATAVLNRDSFGSTDVIHPGELHWTTAGSGIVHEEVPAERGKPCLGLQIFVNLPPELKQVPARADHLSQHDVPVVVTSGGASARVLAGQVGGTASPIQLVYPVTLLDVTLPRGASFEEPVPPGHNVLALVIKGQVQVPGSAEVLKAEHAASLVGGQAVQVSNPGAEEAQVVLFHGTPIDAPIVWRGPFCGNSQQQVAGWLAAYQAGRMGSLEASF